MTTSLFFFWECEACGSEHEYEAFETYPESPKMPDTVTCWECGAKHDVDFDFDPEEGMVVSAVLT